MEKSGFNRRAGSLGNQMSRLRFARADFKVGTRTTFVNVNAFLFKSITPRVFTALQFRIIPVTWLAGWGLPHLPWCSRRVQDGGASPTLRHPRGRSLTGMFPKPDSSGAALQPGGQLEPRHSAIRSRASAADRARRIELVTIAGRFSGRQRSPRRRLRQISGNRNPAWARSRRLAAAGVLSAPGSFSAPW